MIDNMGLLNLKPNSRIGAGEVTCITKCLGYKWTVHKTNTKISNELKTLRKIKNISILNIFKYHVSSIMGGIQAKGI